MPHYLFRASYTLQGIQGVIKEGAASRVAAVAAMADSVGGRIEASYWAFGDDDFLAIVELPDNAARWRSRRPLVPAARPASRRRCCSTRPRSTRRSRARRPTGRRAPDAGTGRQAAPDSGAA